ARRGARSKDSTIEVARRALDNFTSVSRPSYHLFCRLLLKGLCSSSCLALSHLFSSPRRTTCSRSPTRGSRLHLQTRHASRSLPQCARPFSSVYPCTLICLLLPLTCSSLSRVPAQSDVPR